MAPVFESTLRTNIETVLGGLLGTIKVEETEQDRLHVAYGLDPDPFPVKSAPLAEGEVWRDPDDRYSGPWTEGDIRHWVRELPEVLDVVAVVSRLCSTPDAWTASAPLGASLFPDEAKPSHRVGVALRRAVKGGHRLGRSSGPFERDKKEFRSRVPSEVARVVLDELQRHPLHAEALAISGQPRTTA
ncbi:hypothetical protein [Kitasatospora sp. P5_F3]